MSSPSFLQGDFIAHQIVVPAIVLLLLLSCVLKNNGGSEWMTKEPRHQLHMEFNPLERCSSPLESLLGYASDVPAFSNCHRHWESETYIYTVLGYPHEVHKIIPHNSLKTFVITSIGWLADEYVIRYYLHTRGYSVYFGGHQSTSFWEGLQFTGGGSVDRYYERISLLNGAVVETTTERKRHAPRRDDIIVWEEQYKTYFPRGHVAVVVQVEDDVEEAGGPAKLLELKNKWQHPLLVYIAEQNFDNKPWKGRNYSRVLKFSWQKGEKAVLADPDGPPVIGHSRPGKMVINTEQSGDL
ncbi:hypothetical protein TRVL_03968 [Trypanosoma vivax]|uniref:Peptidase C51 domain-containing protein n=1 Tax=Trypanosoma vivax (strain Y486) TaxID=1055687 RepID=G0TSJ8_TRYVY|nr:hypothetical protein TRVL_03968 [Trypanosoma vivax]CCC46925.1 conserved hypothetical protein, fragment [Trypanosoma vivax Y486]